MICCLFIHSFFFFNAFVRENYEHLQCSDKLCVCVKMNFMNTYMNWVKQKKESGKKNKAEAYSAKLGPKYEPPKSALCSWPRTILKRSNPALKINTDALASSMNVLLLCHALCAIPPRTVFMWERNREFRVNNCKLWYAFPKDECYCPRLTIDLFVACGFRRHVEIGVKKFSKTRNFLVRWKEQCCLTFCETNRSESILSWT